MFAPLRAAEFQGAREDTQMSTTNTNGEGRENVRIPFMQRVLDDPFLLLFLGVVVPTVLYTMWAVMEVASIPLGK
ncbi:MAG: hypothetical protein KDJ30_02490 [Rhodoblastus sp.]|nr:hypothetical protein [Rhodoblastus sp.]